LSAVGSVDDPPDCPHSPGTPFGRVVQLTVRRWDVGGDRELRTQYAKL
jgi:hypothetical protein